MRRALTLVLAIALGVALVPGMASARIPDEEVYLSLGTSLAAGSQADAAGDTTFSSPESYTDQLYVRAKGRIAAKLSHVKLGCPGETTDTFVGGTNISGDPSACAGLYETGSQLGDALAALEAGNVVLVTIDLGANDIIQAQVACQGDPTCIGAALGQIAAKVAGIVATMRGSGYAGPIVGMNYYNPQVAAAIGYFPGQPGQLPPDLGLAVLTDVLAQAFNGALENAYETAGADVVDVHAAFNASDFGDDKPHNGIPDNVDVVCALSYMCPDDPEVEANIHLNKHGYRVVAMVFFAHVKSLELAG